MTAVQHYVTFEYLTMLRHQPLLLMEETQPSLQNPGRHPQIPFPMHDAESMET
ncbi:Uncharacterized protein DAT39_008000 [Clarias magur]|uniref:Uncharacterized protein n=1 Tax=Clarias magur TaxID=1594786 RepID=A0A8J4U8U2_CLAMG|nr:Uncharacterized protein DAT39_008000 [Clarias magur]